MDIILKSDIYVVTKILKKTKAEMFRNLKEGSRIMLSIPVSYAGGNGGTYASYIKIENLETKECTYKSFNQITCVLDKFVLKKSE